MYHASRPLTAAQASHYYDTEYSRGDYYTQGSDTIPGRWFGQGAHDLGYAGDVRSDDFSRLLEGRGRDDAQITEAERGTGKRRAGWDFTVSADKSVSIAALVNGDDRLVAAHEDAVLRSLEELERHVQTRQRHGKDDSLRERQTTGRMVAATFRHESSRALDPQLHTHVVVANLTRRADGQWRALEPRELFRAQKLATAVYRSEMARSLDRLGYSVEVRRDGSVGIAGFSRQDLDVFSQRRAEVLRYVREAGTTTGRLGQKAAEASRSTKRKDVDRDSLVAAWRERAREHGIAARDLRPKGPRRSLDVRAEARQSVAHALEHLAERQATFRVSDLERAALEHGMGRVTLADVRAALLERGDVRRAGDVVTTDQAIALEREVLKLMLDGRGQATAIAGDLPAHLSGEQLEAARHVLRRPDLVIGVEGKAGTGKSHLLAAVQAAAQRDGWTVRAFAPTSGAVAVLRSGGLDATTVARLVREKVVPAGDRQLWIVDEAGMLSTQAAADVLRKGREAGAKVVLLGDRIQHKAVEAGQPFAQLVDAGMKTARLGQIRRQHDPELRAAVELAAKGSAGRAVLALSRQGRVEQHERRGDRLKAAVEHFTRAKGTVLVVTATNEDRRALNERIREARIAAGQVERYSFKAGILVSKDMTRAERGRAASYEPGDLVTFRTASKVYEVTPGLRGRVVGLDVDRNELRVRLETGEMVRYNPARLRGVDVARAEERRFAVGDRIEFRQPDKDRGVANGSLGTIKGLDLETGQARVALDNGKRLTLDLARPQAIDHGYVSTSYRSQGRTVDQVIALVEARQASRELVYVAASRGRENAVLITDDRTALVRRLLPEVEVSRALDVERARLIASAKTERETVQTQIYDLMLRGHSRDADGLRQQRYELEQRARPDLDQLEHHDLIGQRAKGGATVEDRLYALRHGPRTDLGSFEDRLPMGDEARLHAAHRTLNERAEAHGWTAARSPLRREVLVRLTDERLQRVLEAAVRVARNEGLGLPLGVYRITIERDVQQLAALASGRRPGRGPWLARER